MERHDYPILEYDPARKAIIEPAAPDCEPFLPEHCVICFFGDEVQRLVDAEGLAPAHEFRSEMGRFPIYVIERNGESLALFQPGIGAPLAAGFLDETIPLGCQKFVVCGGCGVLDRGIQCGHLLVPTAALRDEGTSYHYLPASRIATPSPKAVEAIEAVLDAHGLPYIETMTWTTDGLYRETAAKVAARREEGCLCVEMEASAMFAVAQFRGVTLGQLLYAGDDVSGDEWDTRDWDKMPTLRARVLALAIEACLRL